MTARFCIIKICYLAIPQLQKDKYHYFIHMQLREYMETLFIRSLYRIHLTAELQGNCHCGKIRNQTSLGRYVPAIDVGIVTAQLLDLLFWF